MEETVGFLNHIVGLLHRDHDVRYLILALMGFICFFFFWGHITGSCNSFLTLRETIKDVFIVLTCIL